MTIRTIKQGKRIPKETQEALVQAYISDKNCTICQICQRFGVSEVSARRILRSYGVKLRAIRKPWEPKEDEIVYRMYHEGARLSVIARALGRSSQSVKYRLQVLGLLEPKIQKPQQQPFNTCTLTEGKAYKTKLSGITSELGNLRTILLVYLGKHGRHHLFRSKRGGWKVCFTDIQLADLKLEVA